MFTPNLPSPWKPFNGSIPILILHDTRWDEDLYAAEWEGWSIWIGGGKSFSLFQCSLVEPNQLTPEGMLKHDHRYLMRDFFDTPEQVQAWIDKAVVIAQKAHES